MQRILAVLASLICAALWFSEAKAHISPSIYPI